MPLSRPIQILCVVMSLPVWAHADSSFDRAREVRAGLQEILKDPTPAAYAKYFELFPGTLGEFKQLFATEDSSHRTILEQGMVAGSVHLYFVHACKTYDVVGPERYAEKFLRINAEAGSWGGPPNRDNADLLTAGYLFQNLLFRADCAEPASPALHGAIEAVAARFDDAQLENLYVSLGWNGMEGSGMEWSPVQWLLPRVCELVPARCSLTRQLVDKYQHLIEDEPDSF